MESRGYLHHLEGKAQIASDDIGQNDLVDASRMCGCAEAAPPSHHINVNENIITRFWVRAGKPANKP